MIKFPLSFTEKEDLIVWCRKHLSQKEKRNIQDYSAGNIKLRAIPVYVFDTHGNTIGEFNSIRATARELDVSVSKVSNAIKNRSKLYGMFYISNNAVLELS